MNPDPADTARRQHVATVTGVVIAGVLASFVVPGPYSWGTTLIGVVLAALLIGYGEPPYGWREAFGFSAATAFVLLLTFGIAFDALWNISHWSDELTADGVKQKRSDGWESALIWLGFFAVTLPPSLWHVARKKRERAALEHEKKGRSAKGPPTTLTGASGGK